MTDSNKKKQIMQAVEQLAAKQKLYEITLDEVVRQARIGKGTIYHYFKNKEHLLFEVATSGFDELCELLQQVLCNDAPFTIKFNDMCGQIIQFFSERQQLLQIMQTYSAHIYWSESKTQKRWMLRRKELIDTVSAILSEGAAEGIIRSDLSSDFMAVSLLGLLRAHAKDSDTLSNISYKSKLFADLFLNGACKANGKSAAYCTETFQADKINEPL